MSTEFKMQDSLEQARSRSPRAICVFFAACLFAFWPSAHVLLGQCVGTWVPLAVSGPSPRGGHAMAYDPYRQRVVLFDGSNLGDTWEWDGERWSLMTTVGPSPRSASRMAYDVFRHQLVLFGGANAAGHPEIVFGDTWSWDGISWNQLASTGPSARRGHAMTCDPIAQRIVLYGGARTVPSLVYYNDTWTWDGTAWQQQGVNAPSPRDWHTLTFDPIGARTVLFGGLHTPPTVTLADTWAWNGSGWLPVSLVPSPPGRGTHGACFHAGAQRTVIFGGLGANATTLLGDTWEFDGTSWSAASNSGPPARQHLALAYDETRAQVILFGGATSAGAVGDTWVWAYVPVITKQPASQVTCPGGTADLSVIAAGSGPFTYQWQREISQPPFNWIDISSETSSTLTISNVAPNDAGRYRCVVSNGCGSVNSNPALLTVRVGGYPNCDGSTGTPALTANDFQCFLNSFAAGDPYANCDGSTGAPTLTANDFQCFLNKFAAGCP